MTTYFKSKRRIFLWASAGQAMLLAIALVASGIPSAAIAQTTSIFSGITVPTVPTSPTSPTSPSGSGSTTTTLPTCPTLPTLPLGTGSSTSGTITTTSCVGGGTGGGNGSGGTTTPAFVQVHILKYIQGASSTVPLSASATTTSSFPMEATWTATNLNGGTTTTGTFTLGSGGVNTSFLASGASYTAHEVNAATSTQGSVITSGNACIAGHYRTVGYRSGDTLAGAIGGAVTTAAPLFTNLTADKYLLAVNEFCTTDNMPPTNGGGSGGNGGGTGTTTPGMASTTVVVHYSDLAQTTTNSAGKWFFWNGGTGALDTNVTADAFVTGPGTPPLGTGSVRLTGTDSFSHSIATNQYAGTMLSNITALSFASYIPGIASTTFPVGTTTASTTTSTSTPSTLGSLIAPFLAFNVDLGGTGTGTGQLVYQPQRNGTVATDTWQTWNTVPSGLWSWSGFATSTNGSTTMFNMWPDANGTQYRTWHDIVTAFPRAILSSMFGIGVQNANATTSATSTVPVAFLDNISLTIASTSASSTLASATTTSFDFEPGTGSAGVASSGGGGGGGSSSSGSGTNDFIGGVGGGGAVLGASCPLITSWMREAQFNDSSQVNALQSFLNGEMNSNLSVSGTFDSLTTSSVNDFQVKYWQDVLLPWVPFGLATDHTPTGYVYKTTSTKINRIACPDMTFPNPVLP